MGQSASKATTTVVRASARAPRGDLKQQHFLKEKAPQSSTSTELPQELVDFLKEAGPLKSSEEASKPKVERKRQRESMRLASEVEGFETLKTTNFSDRVDPIDPRELGAGDVVDMYDLLSRSRSDAVSTFLEEQKLKLPQPWDAKTEERHRQMLHNSLAHIELPVVMEDTDETFVGIWPDDMKDMEMARIQPVSRERVRLVLDDLYHAK